MGWWVWELWAGVCCGGQWLCAGVGGRLEQPGGDSYWLTGAWWGVGLGCPGTVGGLGVRDIGVLYCYVGGHVGV